LAPSNSSPDGGIDRRARGGPILEAMPTGPDLARAIATLLPHPVPVTVRENPRVRGVTLRFMPGHGLEVTAGPGVPADWLLAAVTRRRDWLVRVCERLAAEGGLPDATPVPRPERLVLTAFAREWRVHYVARDRAGCLLSVRGPGAVVVSGAVEDAGAVAGVLAAFCRDRAGELLRRALAETSREARLPYAGVTIRAQRTRWGSCTAKGRVSLNYTLAFLPWELTRLVLLHELCHTRELNHSARFWTLLERHIPGCREIDARLGAARHYLPLWLLRQASPRRGCDRAVP
jgi:predicted metal-dependent hydrolase